jgi:hypothetical protein
MIGLWFSFDNLVPNPLTTWLIVVEHASLGFFHRNMDPRLYNGKI